jgi:hypothetical protein
MGIKMYAAEKALIKYGKRTLPAALILGASVHGITKGIGSQDISSSAYELLTGDPQIDDYTFGTNAGISDMLFPSPLPSPTKAFWHGATGARSGLPRMIAGIQSGFLNRGSFNNYNKGNTGYGAGSLAPNYYGNQLPQVDGSIVFGMSDGSHG